MISAVFWLDSEPKTLFSPLIDGYKMLHGPPTMTAFSGFNLHCKNKVAQFYSVIIKSVSQVSGPVHRNKLVYSFCP